MANRFQPPRMLDRGPLGRMLRNPLMQRVIRNSGYLFTGNTLAAGMSMVQSILAARLLGAEQFGILGIITVFASVINRLTSFRMGELVVNYVGEFSARNEPNRAAAAYKSASLVEGGSSVVAFLLIILLAPLGARHLAHDPSSTGLFQMYGLMVLAHIVVESSTGLLQYFDQFRLQAGIQIGQSALTLGLIVAASLAQEDSLRSCLPTSQARWPGLWLSPSRPGTRHTDIGDQGGGVHRSR